MCISFASLALVSFYSKAFIATMSSSQLFVPIVMTGMVMILKGSALVFGWKAPFGDGEEESLL